MSMDKKNYQQIVKQKTPPSKSLTNCLKAFVIGGLICVIGQLISNGLKAASLSEDAVKGLTSASMIFLGSFFTAVGVYDKLAKHGGAGTLVPITGFCKLHRVSRHGIQVGGPGPGRRRKDVRHRRSGARVRHHGFGPVWRDLLLYQGFGG